MLVRFHSQAGPSVLMFGDDARALLLLMGMSGDIPGAVAEEDVLTALDRLKKALEHRKSVAPGEPIPVTGDIPEPPVGLPVRAYPLMQLLEVAGRCRRAVVWEAQSPAI